MLKQSTRKYEFNGLIIMAGYYDIFLCLHFYCFNSNSNLPVNCLTFFCKQLNETFHKKS